MAFETDDNRSSRIDRLILDHLQRRHSGEQVSDEALIAKYPELMPQLADRLELISELSPRKASHSSPGGCDSSYDHRALCVRCPHCRQGIEVLADSDFDDITCSCCGSQFSLAGGSVHTRVAPAYDKIAHFELVERLGFGSFGTVWKARDTELDRTVAVKIPRRGRLDSSEIEKFLREARAAAQLSHQNIVRVYEVGRDGDQVYIVSELVRGVSLADWLTGKQPTFRDAARLCFDLASALHHAHECGVIHRDLKPPNIMLDAEDEPHIMDFGLAKREAGEITMTMDGHVLGTPAYMSPEQARGEAHQVDRRTDIYSLGVILFELMTGELPFRGNARMLIHQVLNDEPPSPRHLNNSIPKDLETICLKCLEKDPALRYSSAQSIADELRRFLGGQPIRARPISPANRAWRWYRRNPVVASLAFLLLTVLVVLGVLAPLVAYQQNKLATEKTLLAEQREQEIHISTVTRLAAESRATRNEMPIRSVLLAMEAAEFDRLKSSKVSSIAHEAVLNSTVSLKGRPLAHNGIGGRWLAGSPDGKWFATHDSKNSILLWNFGSEDSLDSPIVLKVIPSKSSAATFSSDGRRFYVATSAANLAEWHLNDAVSSEPSRVYQNLGLIASFAVSSDGRWLAHVGHDGVRRLSDLHSGSPADSTVQLFDTDVGPVRSDHDEPGSLANRFGRKRSDRESASWISRDNRWIIGCRLLETDVNLWRIDEPTRKPLAIPIGSEITSISVHGLDHQLYVGSQRGRVHRLDLNADKPGAIGLDSEASDAPVTQLARSRDGHRLAAAGDDLRVWSDILERPNRDAIIIRGHSSTRSVALSADSRWLVSGGVDGTVRLWDLEADDAGQNFRVLTGHEQPVIHTWTSFDGRWVVSASLGGVPRAWNCSAPTGSLTPLVLRVSDSGTRHASRDQNRVHLSVSRDGRWLATGAADGTVRLWNTAKENRVSTVGRDLLRHEGAVDAIQIAPDGRWLLTAGQYGETRLSNLEDHNERHTVALPGRVDRTDTIAISADSRWAITGNYAGTIQFVNLAANNPADSVGTFSGHRGRIRSVAISPDSRWAASACDAGDVYLWDLTIQEPSTAPRTLPAH